MSGTDLDVAIVGAGVGGLYAIHRLRKSGFRVRAFEAGDGIGGTWYWNRYPGCRCDVESMEYSYSFSEDLQQDWRWPERYGTQPAILSYVNHVADRFDLRRDVELNTRIRSARFDSEAGLWTLEAENLETGAVRSVRAPLHHGDGQPLDAAHARLSGAGALPGPLVPHRPLAA